MAIGGSILAISIAGRDFSVAADADASLNTGGWENRIQNFGSGEQGIVMERKEWSCTNLALVIDDARDDLKFLHTIRNNGEFVVITIKLVNGYIWQGSAALVGPVEVSTMNVTAPISLAANGDMTPQ